MEHGHKMALLEGSQQVIVQPISGGLAQDTGGNADRGTSSGRCPLGLRVAAGWTGGQDLLQRCAHRLDFGQSD